MIQEKIKFNPEMKFVQFIFQKDYEFQGNKKLSFYFKFFVVIFALKE